MTVDWLHIDAKTDAVEGLTELQGHLEQVSYRPYEWVWAVFAAHRTVQAQALGCLGTAQLLDRMDEPRAEEMYRAIHTGADYPDFRMDRFLPIVDRAIERSDLDVRDETRLGITKLNEIRNNLTHPLFDHSIEIPLVREVVEAALTLITAFAQCRRTFPGDADLERFVERAHQCRRLLEVR